MSHDSSRDPLREALRSLPRARPADDFTDRVVAGIAGDHAGRRPPLTLRWAAAAALAIAGVVAALTLPPLAGSGDPAAARERRARVEALEAERLRLAAELDEIRRLAADLREPAPVLYLGGDERVDLVLDLDRLIPDEARGTGATPASYRRPGSY